VGPGAHVLDVATGTGLVAAEIVRRHGCRVTGLDQSPEMLAVARERLDERVELVQGEAERMPFPEAAFDALSHTYLLRYVEDPAATLRELVRVVRPGGVVAGLEFGVPTWPPAHLAWRLYTGVGLPALGTLVSPEWAHVGRFLARSIPDHYRRYPLHTIVALHRDAGLEDVRVRRMSFGGGVVIWGRRTAG
jgi:demethylmenaquinone methyltransferase/2-methoxy-6-polyprenyl-1,4-benzoquinol methylase